jgi:hypothetical protein
MRYHWPDGFSQKWSVLFGSQTFQNSDWPENGKMSRGMEMGSPRRGTRTVAQEKGVLRQEGGGDKKTNP